MGWIRHFQLTAGIVLFLFTSLTQADDLGYSALQAELGAGIPTGSGVLVSQVEVGGGGPYIPNPADPLLAGKTFTVRSPAASGTSGHASTVAELFYGSGSMAPGITDIDLWETNDWLGSGFLNAQSLTLPSTTTSRIFNDSWAGDFGVSTENLDALQRVDYVVSHDEALQIVAVNNQGGTNEPLLASSFNAIAVSRVGQTSPSGSIALTNPGDPTGGPYQSVRTKPDIVGPNGVNSNNAPQVAAVAALLIQTAHTAGLTLSHGSQTVNGQTIYNGETTEVIKAALMAGANRSIPSYTLNTSNNLNSNLGSGEVNVYNSYHVIAGGEQEPGGNIAQYGFDYNPAFNSSQTEVYRFKTGATANSLTASLVWNVKTDAVAFVFSGTGAPPPLFGLTTLYNLDLVLHDDTTNTNVQSSLSTVDNTQNIDIALTPNHLYDLRIFAAPGQSSFTWDYGLAWDFTSAVLDAPEPASLTLLVGGSILVFRRPREKRRYRCSNP